MNPRTRPALAGLYAAFAAVVIEILAAAILFGRPDAPWALGGHFGLAVALLAPLAAGLGVAALRRSPGGFPRWLGAPALLVALGVAGTHLGLRALREAIHGPYIPLEKAPAALSHALTIAAVPQTLAIVGAAALVALYGLAARPTPNP